jgi:hypothetical protein
MEIIKKVTSLLLKDDHDPIWIKSIMIVFILLTHDLRANASGVCREGKPVPTFPDHA